jgi:hypothetical protein
MSVPVAEYSDTRTYIRRLLFILFFGFIHDILFVVDATEKRGWYLSTNCHTKSSEN